MEIDFLKLIGMENSRKRAGPFSKNASGPEHKMSFSPGVVLSSQRSTDSGGV